MIPSWLCLHPRFSATDEGIRCDVCGKLWPPAKMHPITDGKCPKHKTDLKINYWGGYGWCQECGSYWCLKSGQTVHESLKECEGSA